MSEQWRPCWKRPLRVEYREQQSGDATVSTREGLTPLKPDDLIIRGVAGECYPIGRGIFEATYTTDEPESADASAEIALLMDAGMKLGIEIAELKAEIVRLKADRRALVERAVNFTSLHPAWSLRDIAARVIAAHDADKEKP